MQPHALVYADQNRYGAAHARFAASFTLPVPSYFAYCGYGQTGRVMAASRSERYFICAVRRIHGWMQHWNLTVPAPSTVSRYVAPGGTKSSSSSAAHAGAMSGVPDSAF